MVIDKGVALPHLLRCRTARACMSVITLDKPVRFNHADNDPVNLKVMLLSNHTAHYQGAGGTGGCAGDKSGKL